MHGFSTRVIVAAGISLMGLTYRPAVADEQLLPLAASGDWIAAAHADSATDPPDVCVAATTDASPVFILRASTDDIEVRFADDSWSLPAAVKGALAVDVGTYHAALDISYNTSSMVMAVITPEQLQAMVAAMDKAGSMTVTAGKAAPITISLNGSNKATTAFLTCAGIRAPGEGGGANPFQ